MENNKFSHCRLPAFDRSLRLVKELLQTQEKRT